MNLSNLTKQKETDEQKAPVELLDRTDTPMRSKDGKPWTWYVVGEFSEAGRAFDRQQHSKVRKLIRRGDFDGGDYDESEQAAIDKVLAHTVGFENIEDADGVAVPYTAKNAEAILRAAPWFVPQIRRRIQRHADFFVKVSAG